MWSKHHPWATPHGWNGGHAYINGYIALRTTISSHLQLILLYFTNKCETINNERLQRTLLSRTVVLDTVCRDHPEKKWPPVHLQCFQPAQMTARFAF